MRYDVYRQAVQSGPLLGGRDERLRRGRRLTVRQWEQVVVLRDGVVTVTLGPGAHRRWAGREVGRQVDLRPWLLPFPTQEVPTADGLSVKVTLAAAVRVSDPVAYVTASQDPHGAVYLAAQVALREVVGRSTVDDLVGGRAAVGAELLGAVHGVDEVGLAIDRLELKDVVLPSELRRAQSQVLVARAEGQAALERARGETAALRSLANAARLAADNPSLLQLRLLQQLESGGNTVVLGAAGLTPPPGSPTR